MKLSDLSNLKRALDFMGMDIGADTIATATIPTTWEMRCQIADTELASLSHDETATLAGGEETEMERIAKKAAAAHEVMNAAFDDGELAEVFFRGWRNIFDARAAEHRVTN